MAQARSDETPQNTYLQVVLVILDNDTTQPL